MVAIRNEKISLEIIARELELMKRVDANGRVAYQGLVRDWASVIATAIQLDSSIPRAEYQGIVFGALCSPTCTAILTRKVILKAIAIAEQAYVSAAKQRYVVATSVSIWPGFPRLRRVIDGSIVRVRGSAHPRYSRKSLRKLLAENQHEEWHAGYSQVLVSVESHNPRAAFRDAMDRIDLLRALWNWCLNFPLLERGPQQRREPLNQIRLGRVHTVHFPNGKLAIENYWFEDDFQTVRYPLSNGETWKRAVEVGEVVRSYIRRSSYRRWIEHALRRYVRALDISDPQSALVQLWGLLETLTGCEDGKQDNVVRRASFVFQDPEIERPVLEHLRLRRNSAAHASWAGEEQHASDWVVQARRYVERLLRAHWGIGRAFDTPTELGEWLHLPTDPATLRLQIRRRRRALRFRSP